MPRAVVVGAGAIGLLAAYELRRRGADVVLLDRGQPGMACSSGNAGWVVPSFCTPLPAPGVVGTALRWMLSRTSPLRIRPRLDLDLARWLWIFWRRSNPGDYRAGVEAVARLNRDTFARYDALRADGLAFEMRADGVLFAFVDPRARDRLFAELEHLTRFGVAAPQRLDGDAVRAAEPALSAAVAGAILVPRERHVRPESLTAALARRVVEMGVDVRPGAAVTGAARRGAAVRSVATPAGPVDGDVFLIAAGAWSAAVSRAFGFTFPMQAGKGYSVTFRDPPFALRRPVYLDEARVACTPFGGALRLAGTMELSGLRPAADPRRVAAIERAARRYLRAWTPASPGVAWMGMRPVPPDGLPLIGRVPGSDNLFLATGHAMFGITLAPVTGAAVADLMTGRAPDADLAPFDPARLVRRL